MIKCRIVVSVHLKFTCSERTSRTPPSSPSLRHVTVGSGTPSVAHCSSREEFMCARLSLGPTTLTCSEENC